MRNLTAEMACLNDEIHRFRQQRSDFVRNNVETTRRFLGDFHDRRKEQASRDRERIARFVEQSRESTRALLATFREDLDGAHAAWFSGFHGAFQPHDRHERPRFRK